MFSNPITAYQQVSIESEIRGADPHQLIVMLFDATEAALQRAKQQIAEQDIVGKTDSINKAISIILEGLAASLNVEKGGTLAEQLQSLYSYMVSRLVYANIHMDVTAIEEVERLLGDIAGAWRKIRPEVLETAATAQANR